MHKYVTPNSSTISLMNHWNLLPKPRAYFVNCILANLIINYIKKLKINIKIKWELAVYLERTNEEGKLFQVEFNRANKNSSCTIHSSPLCSNVLVVGFFAHSNEKRFPPSK